MNRNHSHVPQKQSLYSTGVSPRKLKILDDYAVPGRVLDVGCGNGLYGLHLASKGCELLQVDLEDRRDERARHLPFRIMDVQKFDLAENTFDNVIAFDIMEHLDDDVQFIQNIRRVCKQRLFLSVPNGDDEQIAKFGVSHIHHKDKTHQREYSVEQLKTMLVEIGFKVLVMQPNYATGLPYFAHALAKSNLASKLAARLVTFQCKVLLMAGLFENRTVGDWYCVAENGLTECHLSL